MAKTTAAKAVLITTEHRGVFFGYVKDDKKWPATITLTGARNCIYWASSLGGFMGLAATGPNKDCRIGARVDEIEIVKCTSRTPVSDAAVKAWEDAKVYG